MTREAANTTPMAALAAVLTRPEVKAAVLDLMPELLKQAVTAPVFERGSLPHAWGKWVEPESGRDWAQALIDWRLEDEDSAQFQAIRDLFETRVVSRLPLPRPILAADLARAACMQLRLLLREPDPNWAYERFIAECSRGWPHSDLLLKRIHIDIDEFTEIAREDVECSDSLSKQDRQVGRKALLEFSVEQFGLRISVFINCIDTSLHSRRPGEAVDLNGLEAPMFARLTGLATKSALEECQEYLADFWQVFLAHSKLLRRTLGAPHQSQDDDPDDYQYEENPWAWLAFSEASQRDIPDGLKIALRTMAPPNRRQQTTLEYRFKNACQLLRDADREETSVGVRLSLCMSALEALLCEKKDGIADELSKRAVSLLEPDSDARIAAWGRVKRLYDIRSRVLHGEAVESSPAAALAARRLAAGVMHAMLDWRRFMARLDDEGGDRKEFLMELQAAIDRAKPMVGAPEGMSAFLPAEGDLG